MKATMLSKPLYPQETKILLDDIRQIVVVKTPWKNKPHSFCSYNKDPVLHVERWLTYYKIKRIEREKMDNPLLGNEECMSLYA